MTGPMNMNRLIHAAVRRDFARLESALGSARDGDRERATQLETAFANLQRELTAHHKSEDALVFPFVAKVADAPDLLAAMEDEHHAMAAALAETRDAMVAYAATGSAAEAASARDSTVRTQTVVDQHLDHEEAEFEPLLLPHVTTPGWKAVEKKLQREGSLTEGGNFMAWVQDGMSAEGREFLNSTIPRPVTFLLSRLAGRRYRRDIAPVWQS